MRSLVPLACIAALSILVLSAAEPGAPRARGVAKGSFEVAMAPDGEAAAADGVSLGRMRLEKTFSGDFSGTGKGTMLTAMTATKGSAGYVAIERVTGTLNGKTGSFTLQHSGTMDRGAQHLSIAIVPDSGTGGLAGIEGTLTVTIADGKHLYELEYSLEKAR